MGKAARAVVDSHPDANFVPSAGQGCHIAHGAARWQLGSERYRRARATSLSFAHHRCRRSDYEAGAVLPDLALDEDSGRLTAVNTQGESRVFYVSTRHECFDGQGRQLAAGIWRREETPVEEPCTTFVLLLPPRTLFHVCYVRVPEGEGPDLHSDVQALSRHPSPEGSDAEFAYPFPLGGGGPFLCTQGEGGVLSHFFAETLHAVDFRCPVGTPLLALADGVVHSLQVSHSCSGCHVSNLFHWNSVMVAHDDGTFAEYVHVSAVLLAAGERVHAGQHIAESGDIGFAPEPHLHLQLHASPEPGAPTLRFALMSRGGGTYRPRAGCWYDAEGETQGCAA